MTDEIKILWQRAEEAKNKGDLIEADALLAQAEQIDLQAAESLDAIAEIARSSLRRTKLDREALARLMAWEADQC